MAFFPRRRTSILLFAAALIACILSTTALSIAVLLPALLPRVIGSLLPESVEYQSISLQHTAIRLVALKYRTEHYSIEAESLLYNPLTKTATLQRPTLTLTSWGLNSESTSPSNPHWITSVMIVDGTANVPRARLEGVSGTIELQQSNIQSSNLVVRRITSTAIKQGHLSGISARGTITEGVSTISGAIAELRYDNGNRAVFAHNLSFNSDLHTTTIAAPTYELLYDQYYQQGKNAALAIHSAHSKLQASLSLDAFGSVSLSTADYQRFSVAGTIPELSTPSGQRLLQTYLGESARAIGQVAFELAGDTRQWAGTVSATLHTLEIGAFRAKNIRGSLPLASTKNAKSKPSTVSVEQLDWGDRISSQAPLTFRTQTNQLLTERVTLNAAGGQLEIGQLQLGMFPLRARVDSVVIESVPVDSMLLQGELQSGNYESGTVSTVGSIRTPFYNGNLRIENPSVSANGSSFSADAYFSNVDLAKLSAAFAVGSITGTISGSITSVAVVDGIPTNFIVSVANTRGGSITVEALENLGIMTDDSLVASLSRGIYKLIDTYRYKAIGFRASLAENILSIVGTAQPGSNDFLITGGLLPPTVTVRLASSTVRFDEFRERLRRIQRSN